MLLTVTTLAGNQIHVEASQDWTGVDLVRACSDVSPEPNVELILLHGDEQVGFETPLSEVDSLVDGSILTLVRCRRDFLICGAIQGTVHLWKPGETEPLKTWEAHDERITRLAFSGDYSCLVTVSKETKIWDVPTFNCLRTLPGTWLQCFPSNDGQRFLTVGEVPTDFTAKVWARVDEKQDAVLEGHAGMVLSAAFSLAGRIILTGSEDRCAKLWDAETLTCTQTLEGHRGAIKAVSLHPDDKFVLTSSRDWSAKLWSLESGLCIKTLDRTFEAYFSLDGMRILAQSEDGTLKLWSHKADFCFAELKAQDSAIFCAAFSPDSEVIATGGLRDGLVALWNGRTGEQLAAWQAEETSGVIAARVLHDKKTLYTTSWNGCLRCWDISEALSSQAKKPKKSVFPSVLMCEAGMLAAAPGMVGGL